jgi:hypothetical protein
MDGDPLRAKPASLMNQPLREVIQANKAALVAALSIRSPYWLVGEAHEILRALKLMATNEGLREVALCVIDAERQLAGVLMPTSQQGAG